MKSFFLSFLILMFGSSSSGSRHRRSARLQAQPKRPRHQPTSDDSDDEGTPPPTYEFPTPMFSSRQIKPECEFRRHITPTTESAFTFLDSIGFTALLTPAASKYYPCLVALFYQNLQRAQDNLSFTTSVDGHQFVINDECITKDFGIPPYYPEDSAFQAPTTVNFNTMAESLYQRGTIGSTFIRHTSLPVNLWYLDLIFFHNIAAIGHKSERRSLILDMLYSALNDIWFSPAAVIRQSMIVITTRCQTVGNRYVTHKLFFPFLITRLLLNSGYAISEDEDYRTDTGTFDWDRSKEHSIAELKKKLAYVHQHGAVPNPMDFFDEDLDFIPSSEEDVPRRRRAAPTDFARIEDKLDDVTDMFQSFVHVQPEETQKLFHDCSCKNYVRLARG